MMELEKKITLTMRDGVEVHDLDELRRHYDHKLLMKYFRDGRLVEWLRERNYEEEAKSVEAIDVNRFRVSMKLAWIFVRDNLDILSAEYIIRASDRRDILSSKTDDWDILKNAIFTALTQEDLEDLIDCGYPKLYLCGEEFTVPLEAEKRHYIGVLGTPKININATKQSELDERFIMFENVMLPWGAPPPFLPNERDNEFRICKAEAESGHVYAMEKLADRYYFGDGIPLDKQKAIEWYEKAAAAGNEYAIKTILTFHRNGTKVNVNTDQLQQWQAQFPRSANRR